MIYYIFVIIGFPPCSAARHELYKLISKSNQVIGMEWNTMESN